MSLILDSLGMFARTFLDEMLKPSGPPGAWNSTQPTTPAPDTTVGMDCPVCDHLKAMAAIQWDTAELIGRYEPFDLDFQRRYIVPLVRVQAEYSRVLGDITQNVHRNDKASRKGRKHRAKWGKKEMADIFGIDLE